MTFHLSRDSEVVGEFEELDFQEKIFSGEIQPEDQYWHEGMADWAAVSEYRAPHKAVAVSQATSKKPLVVGIPRAMSKKTLAVIAGIVSILLVFIFIDSNKSTSSRRALTIADRERIEAQAQAEAKIPSYSSGSSILSQLSRQAEENMRLAKEHKIRVGMIGEQVEMAWGKPEQLTRVEDATGEGEQWIYPNGDRLYFSDDTLKYIDTTRRR